MLEGWPLEIAAIVAINIYLSHQPGALPVNLAPVAAGLGWRDMLLEETLATLVKKLIDVSKLDDPSRAAHANLVAEYLAVQFPIPSSTSEPAAADPKIDPETLGAAGTRRSSERELPASGIFAPQLCSRTIRASWVFWISTPG